MSTSSRAYQAATITKYLDETERVMRQCRVMLAHPDTQLSDSKVDNARRLFYLAEDLRSWLGQRVS